MSLTKDEWLELTDISIFYQYLALGKTITFNNGIADLELKMDLESPFLPIYSKNLNYPDLKPLGYDDMLYLGNILGIIDYLKKQPSTINPKTDSLWDEIKFNVTSTKLLNKYNKR